MSADAMAEYRRALAAHDWFYDFSDDHGAWSRGNAQRTALRGMRARLDPTGAVWNEFAPAEYRTAATPEGSAQ